MIRIDVYKFLDLLCWIVYGNMGLKFVYGRRLGFYETQENGWGVAAPKHKFLGSKALACEFSGFFGKSG